MKVNNSINNNLNGLSNIQSNKLDKNLDAFKDSAIKSKGLDDSSKVDVSDKARMMNKAIQLATPDRDSIDEAKVARLQKMIDEGEYKVDAEAVADRLVDEHFSMLE